MNVVNYTALKKREKNVYSIMGLEIPGGGVPINLLIIIAVYEVIFNAIAIIICKKFDLIYFNLIGEDMGIGFIFIIAGAVLGFFTYKWKIKGHPCYLYIIQAIKIFISPKYRDIDNNVANDLEVDNCLYTEDEN